MIWKTTNALGQEVTWYSEDEIKKIKNCCQETYFKTNEAKQLKNFILQILEGLENGQETS